MEPTVTVNVCLSFIQAKLEKLPRGPAGRGVALRLTVACKSGLHGPITQWLEGPRFLCFVLVLKVEGKYNPVIPFWPEVEVACLPYKHTALLWCFNTHPII